MLRDIYGNTSLALVTDLYELTMAYGYWKSGMTETEAVFHLFFRERPFDGGFAIAAGLEAATDFLDDFHFDDSDIAYLRAVTDAAGEPLFPSDFVDYLQTLRLTLDIDAVPEGTVVFGYEPLVRVRGPLLQAQIVESALLNAINFQTLIATKAARIAISARGEPVLEFGLRRAQGIDGALSASRAAYIGGCAATSNVLAGKLFGIPVRGTHAHSWVMSFDSERASFEAFARAMPTNSVFLVDTYNTIEGVRTAAEVGKRMREQGYELAGIRLDSGDLAYLSQEARKILDAAGLVNASITASNDLDENIINSLHEQHAAIGIWGVGTRLVTGHDDPALGGVYKLGMIKPKGGEWSYRLKLSEQSAKTSIPGMLQTRRYVSSGLFAGDMIYDEHHEPAGAVTMIDPIDPIRRKSFGDDGEFSNLLVPVYRGGRRLGTPPPLDAIRERVDEQLSMLHPGVKRFVNPHTYPVGLEQVLHDLRMDLILRMKAAK